MRDISPAEGDREIEGAARVYASDHALVLVLSVDVDMDIAVHKKRIQPNMSLAGEWLLRTAEVRELGGVYAGQTNVYLKRKKQ